MDGKTDIWKKSEIAKFYFCLLDLPVKFSPPPLEFIKATTSFSRESESCDLSSMRCVSCNGLCLKF